MIKASPITLTGREKCENASEGVLMANPAASAKTPRTRKNMGYVCYDLLGKGDSNKLAPERYSNNRCR